MMRHSKFSTLFVFAFFSIIFFLDVQDGQGSVIPTDSSPAPTDLELAAGNLSPTEGHQDNLIPRAPRKRRPRRRRPKKRRPKKRRPKKRPSKKPPSKKPPSKKPPPKKPPSNQTHSAQPKLTESPKYKKIREQRRDEIDKKYYTNLGNIYKLYLRCYNRCSKKYNNTSPRYKRCTKKCDKKYEKPIQDEVTRYKKLRDEEEKKQDDIRKQEADIYNKYQEKVAVTERKRKSCRLNCYYTYPDYVYARRPKVYVQPKTNQNRKKRAPCYERCETDAQSQRQDEYRRRDNEIDDADQKWLKANPLNKEEKEAGNS